MSNYPLINGFAYTLATAHVDFLGARFVGISNLKWGEAMEGREMVPGAALFYVARTPGIYKATCEFEILTSEYLALIQKIGPGFMMKPFNVGAQMVDPAGVLPLLTIEYPGLMIDDAAGSLEQKASTVVVKTQIGPGQMISYNGITAIAGGALGGQAGNTFGGSASVVASVGASVGFSL